MMLCRRPCFMYSSRNRKENTVLHMYDSSNNSTIILFPIWKYRSRAFFTHRDRLVAMKKVKIFWGNDALSNTSLKLSFLEHRYSKGKWIISKDYFTSRNFEDILSKTFLQTKHNSWPKGNGSWLTINFIVWHVVHILLMEWFVKEHMEYWGLPTFWVLNESVDGSMWRFFHQSQSIWEIFFIDEIKPNLTKNPTFWKASKIETWIKDMSFDNILNRRFVPTIWFFSIGGS